MHDYFQKRKERQDLEKANPNNACSKKRTTQEQEIEDMDDVMQDIVLSGEYMQEPIVSTITILLLPLHRLNCLPFSNSLVRAPTRSSELL